MTRENTPTGLFARKIKEVSIIVMSRLMQAPPIGTFTYSVYPDQKLQSSTSVLESTLSMLNTGISTQC